jgi:para-nitrobenzyl esterase
MKTWSIAFVFLTAVAAGNCGDSTKGADNGGGKGGGGGRGGSGGTDGESDSGSSDLLRITTNKGPVRGTMVDAMRVFLGIPYAQPPVGELRWKPPRPATAWSDVLEATAIRPACPQIDLLTNQPLAGASEDCLTLNV